MSSQEAASSQLIRNKSEYERGSSSSVAERNPSLPNPQSDAMRHTRSVVRICLKVCLVASLMFWCWGDGRKFHRGTAANFDIAVALSTSLSTMFSISRDGVGDGGADTSVGRSAGAPV